MQTADFDYDLPDSAIAQQASARRDAARLLVDNGPDVPVGDQTVADLPGLLSAGDLLVVNTTRVLRARLLMAKDTGGAAEVLLVRPLDTDNLRWEAMVRPGRRLPPGTVLRLADPGTTPLSVTVGDLRRGGLREVTLSGTDDPLATIDAVGQLPLPPYIHGPLADPERYQTVFADRALSVAAPTAGLHLTDELLAACRSRGVEVAHVELAIGPGTFLPVTADRLEDHVMHAEWYRVPGATIDAIQLTNERGGDVVAVGTTVVRALESWAATGADTGDTSLFITPGFEFAVVDRLMTNFHQPRSTLLALVEAFMGPRWRQLYDHALASGYRFLSLGDSMVVWRTSPTVGTNDASGEDQ